MAFFDYENVAGVRGLEEVHHVRVKVAVAVYETVVDAPNDFAYFRTTETRRQLDPPGKKS